MLALSESTMWYCATTEWKAKEREREEAKMAELSKRHNPRVLIFLFICLISAPSFPLADSEGLGKF